MATLSITITQSEVLELAKALEKVAHEAGYKNRTTGALVFDNAPATGTASVVFASGTTRIV